MGESFEDGPDRGRILVSGDDTGGRWSLMEYEVAARPADEPQGYGPHLHDKRLFDPAVQVFVRHRTDQDPAPAADGFLIEATRDWASEFE